MPVTKKFRKSKPKSKIVKKRKSYPKRRSQTGSSITVSETINLGRFPTQAGNYFLTQLSQIPQVAQYANLYRQYMIKRIKYTLIPDWDSYDPNSGGGAINVPRLSYAIANSVNATSPLNEQVMLEENGCRLMMFNKPCKVSVTPVAWVGVSVATGGFASENRPYRWLATAQPTVPHGGLRVFLANGGPPVFYTVYATVTLAFKDPQ